MTNLEVLIIGLCVGVLFSLFILFLLVAIKTDHTMRKVEKMARECEDLSDEIVRKTIENVNE